MYLINSAVQLPLLVLALSSKMSSQASSEKTKMHTLDAINKFTSKLSHSDKHQGYHEIHTCKDKQLKFQHACTCTKTLHILIMSIQQFIYMYSNSSNSIL